MQTLIDRITQYVLDHYEDANESTVEQAVITELGDTFKDILTSVFGADGEIIRLGQCTFDVEVIIENVVDKLHLKRGEIL